MFKSAVIASLSLLFSMSAFADCSLLVSSRFQDETKEIIRSELARNGVTAQFVRDIGGFDEDSLTEEIPTSFQAGDLVALVEFPKNLQTSPYYLAQLYTSSEDGVYNMTTTTDFAFGLARMQYCKNSDGGYTCKANLKAPGLVFERVVSHSTRDLIVAGGELKDLNRMYASEAQIRTYLAQVAAKVCK